MNSNLGAVAHVANDTAWVPLTGVIFLGECKVPFVGICRLRHLEAACLKVLLQRTEALNLGGGIAKVQRQNEVESAVVAIGWRADVDFKLLD